MKINSTLSYAVTGVAFGLCLITASCSKKAENVEPSEESVEGLKTPFESLPDSTIAAVRFDNSASMRKQYVDSTKLGKLLFSEEKIEEYKTFLDALVEKDEKAAQLVAKLEEVGLELDDIYGMISSDIGVAVIKQEVPGFSPMPTLLVWAEMEQSVVDRVYSAILTAAADKEKLERIDQEMAGVVGTRIRNTEKGDSFLTAKLENRFLFALGFPVDQISSMEEAEVFEESEWQALGYFVQAQQGEGGGFLDAFYSDPGVSNSRPNYKVRLEALGDLGEMLNFVPVESAQAVALLNLKQFDKLGIWSGLVGSVEHSTVYVGAPSPRDGLATMIEGETFDFQPPAWVPASVNGYSTFSFDMSKFYDVALGILRTAIPPDILEQQIAQANTQLGGTVQADLDTIFGSFGNRVSVLEFAAEKVDVDSPAANLGLEQAQSAFVLDFSRPDILERAIGLASMVASNPDAGISLVDEQGFSGVRMQSPGGIITIAHSNGKLVFAVGNSAASKVFSTLNNPPEGNAALVNDQKFRDFMSRNSPKQGIGFSYSQGDNALKNLVTVFTAFENAMARSTDEQDAELLEELMALIPDEEDFEDMLGAVFSRGYYNEWGLVIEGVNEYK